MKKFAVLIGSPTEPYLNGVKYDLENVKKFLMSSNGGAWEDVVEIFVSKFNPTLEEIKKELDKFKSCDFAFIYFSGHGFINTETGYDTLVLNFKEKIIVTSIQNLCKRQITIIDACRANFPTLSHFEGPTKDYMSFDQSNLEFSKHRFNDYLNNCGNGNALLFACQSGQSAEDTSLGGYFSINLLKSGKELSQTSQKSISTIKEVFDFTCENIKHKHEHQPQFINLNIFAKDLPFTTSVFSEKVILKTDSNIFRKYKSCFQIILALISVIITVLSFSYFSKKRKL